MNLIFPRHTAGMILQHNMHKSFYDTVESYIKSGQCEDMEAEWATPTSRANSILHDELWELSWYPNTPVGSCCIYGYTLEEVLERAKKVELDLDSH